jgi:hypothetical protein
MRVGAAINQEYRLTLPCACRFALSRLHNSIVKDYRNLVASRIGAGAFVRSQGRHSFCEPHLFFPGCYSRSRSPESSFRITASAHPHRITVPRALGVTLFCLF